MPFPMRIQPIDSVPNDIVKPPPPVLKSRLKRLFDRPFKISSAEFEPNSVCLDKMVQNFIEEENKSSSKFGCNCFNGNSNDISDDEEFDFFSDSSSSYPLDTLKSLVVCANVVEMNLLAEASRIVEKNSKVCRRKNELRKIVSDGLTELGYDASVCRSKWDKSSSIPSGEYEYIDVIIKGERVIIDVDFRSEFEIARSTNNYKQILQCLPYIFIGKSDRLLKIVTLVSGAARMSLKKKGMHIPPWRKAEYMKSKWLGFRTRVTQNDVVEKPESNPDVTDSIFGREMAASLSSECESGQNKSPVNMTWQLPVVKPKSLEKGNKAVVTGLASLLKEKN